MQVLLPWSPSQSEAPPTDGSPLGGRAPGTPEAVPQGSNTPSKASKSPSPTTPPRTDSTVANAGNIPTGRVVESVLNDLHAQLVQATSGVSMEQFYRPLLELYAQLTTATGCTLGAPATAAAERLNEIVITRSSPAPSMDEPDMEPAVSSPGADAAAPSAASQPARAPGRGRSSSPGGRLGGSAPVPAAEGAKPLEMHPQEMLLVELERCRMRLEDRRISDAADAPSPSAGGLSPPAPSKPAAPERLTSKAEEHAGREQEEGDGGLRRRPLAPGAPTEERALEPEGLGRPPSPGRCQSVPPQPETSQPPSPRDLPPPGALRLGRLSRSTPPCRTQQPRKCLGEPAQASGGCTSGSLRRKRAGGGLPRKPRRSSRLEGVPEGSAEALAMQEAQVLLSEMLRHCGTSSCSRPRAEPPERATPPRPSWPQEPRPASQGAPPARRESAGLRPLNGSMPWFPATELGLSPAKKATSRPRTAGPFYEEEERSTPPTASTASAARQSLGSDVEESPTSPAPAGSAAAAAEGADAAPGERPPAATTASAEASDAEFCRLLASALEGRSL